MSTEKQDLKVLTPTELKIIENHWTNDTWAGVWYSLKIIVALPFHALWKIGLTIYNIILLIKGRKYRSYTVNYIRKSILLVREISKLDVPLTAGFIWYGTIYLGVSNWIAWTYTIVGLLVWSKSLANMNAYYYMTIQSWANKLNEEGRIKESSDNDSPLINV